MNLKEILKDTDSIRAMERALSERNNVLDRDEALTWLRAINGNRDAEAAHGLADAILLALIDDVEIQAAFESLEKWYS